MTNSDLLEELLQECWSLGIIEEVRAEAKKRLDRARTPGEMYDTYYDAYKKILEKERNETFFETKRRSTI